MTHGHRADEVFCQHCGGSIKKQAEICPDCGVKNNGNISGQSTDIYCRSCGESIKRQAEICPDCGVRNGYTSANNPSSLDIDLLRVGAIGFGVLFLLAGLGAMTGGSILRGLSYLAIGLVLLPQVRRRISKEYSITTFGYVASVDEAIMSEPDLPCSACQNPVGDGVQRKHTKQFVLFGAPIFTSNEGENIYCQSCANGEVREINIPAQ